MARIFRATYTHITCPTCGTVVHSQVGDTAAVCPECQGWLPVEKIPDVRPVEAPKKRKSFPAWILPVGIPAAIFALVLLICAAVAAAGGTTENGPGSLIAVFAFGALLLILAVVYFAPILIAESRGHPNATPIAVLNVLLGWTFLGWVAALVWSLTAFEQPRRRG